MDHDLASQLSTQLANLTALMSTIIAMVAVMIGVVLGNAFLAYLNRLASKLLGVKLDANTALTATSLVSSGNLPKSAPCIPAVAKALSDSPQSCQSAITYADTAISKAHETMEERNIPIQSQELLVKKMQVMIADLIAKEARHNANNIENAKVWAAEAERLKAEMAAIKANNQTTRENIRGESGGKIG